MRLCFFLWSMIGTGLCFLGFNDYQKSMKVLLQNSLNFFRTLWRKSSLKLIVSIPPNILFRESLARVTKVKQINTTTLEWIDFSGNVRKPDNMNQWAATYQLAIILNAFTFCKNCWTTCWFMLSSTPVVSDNCIWNFKLFNIFAIKPHNKLSEKKSSMMRQTKATFFRSFLSEHKDITSFLENPDFGLVCCEVFHGTFVSTNDECPINFWLMWIRYFWREFTVFTMKHLSKPYPSVCTRHWF